MTSMTRSRFAGITRFAIAYALAGTACSPEQGPVDAHSLHDGSEAATDARSLDIVPTDASRPDDIVSLAIDPPAAMLTSTDGSMPNSSFQLLAVHRDGSRAPVPALSWTLGDAHFGSVSMTGTFTASGLAAGSVPLTATALASDGSTLSAMASITITATRTVSDTGAPPDASTHFPGTAGTDATFTLAYPLDNAFMPNNVYPPVIQWTGGTTGNVTRIQLETPHLTVTAYTVSGTDSWLVDSAAWRALAASDGGSPIAIHADQFNATTGTVISTPPVHLRIARGGIYGDVYYWNVGQGLRRINAATARFENFLPSPPTGCIACHAISHDGRYLAGILEGSDSVYHVGIFDLTQDLSVNPAPTVFAPPTQASAWAAFSADGAHFITAGFGAVDGYSQPGFALFDAHTGARETPDAMPASMNVTHPDWAPDGNSVVYVDNVAGTYPGTPGGIHFTTSNLFVTTVTGTSHLVFGTPRMLHLGSDLSTAMPAGGADARPVFSPDSRLVVFQHGACAYGQYHCPNALYVIPVAGGPVVRLDNANGGAMGDSAYWPSFSPYVTREPTTAGTSPYGWVAFYSRRDYGNVAAGSRARRQLWVSAIRLDTGGAADPSSVPYWLPGQNPASENAGGQWAPEPCRSNGSDCTAGDECCTGLCRPGGSGMTCQPPETCRTEGQACGGTGDCCTGTGLVCFGNVCGIPPG